MSSPSPPQVASACRLVLSPWSYRVCWLLTVLCHVALALLSACTVWLHRYLQQDELVYLTDYLNENVHQYFGMVMFVHGLVSACHCYAVVSAVGWSIYYQTLVFGRKKTPTKTPVVRTKDKHCFERLVDGCRRVFAVLFGRRGLFGMENENFMAVHLAREWIEIVFQTSQAYKLSFLVATIWINRLFAVAIAINCWATPLVQVVLRQQHEHARKIWILVLDFVLDLTSLIIIPLAIFWPYQQAFVIDQHDFALELYYHDTWFINAVSENQQLFVTSWWDWMAKSFPAVAILSTMRSLKCSIVPPSNQIVAFSVASPSFTKESSPIRPNASRLYQHLYALVYVWGLGVLVLHFHSSSVAWTNATRGCLLEMRPWFSTSYNCVVYEINCSYRPNGPVLQGTQEELTASMAQMERSMLRHLIFASCPALEMPPVIQTLPNLQIIKIYNSTIASWTEDAAITAALHPTLQLLYVLDSNLSGIPDGLLHDDFPPTLTDIEFSGTNLTGLPVNLHEKWTAVNYFVLENSPQIVEFPETLRRMSICHLSLCQNGIQALPDDYFVHQLSTLYALQLTGNPITTLSDAYQGPLGPYEVSMAFTNLSSIPQWVLDMDQPPMHWPEVDLVLSAGGTPLCESMMHNHTNTTSDQTIRLHAYAVLDCRTSDDAVQRLLYPVDQERAWRWESRQKMLLN